jgi:hypothetical protein
MGRHEGHEEIEGHEDGYFVIFDLFVSFVTVRELRAAFVKRTT